MLQQAIQSLIGYYLVWTNRVAYYFSSWIPSHVVEVKILSMHDERLHSFYHMSRSGCWPLAHKHTSVLKSMDDYFLIRVWNADHKQHHTYFLSAAKLCEALRIQHISSLWTLHDYAIVKLLANSQHSQHHWNLFSIMYKHQDISYSLRSILPSLSLPGNVTAKAVCMLYELWMNNNDRIPDDNGNDYELCIADYNLEEHIRTNDEFIV